jgi:hypothetical protein
VPQKKKISDVRCVLCGGNHPANHKRSTGYKDLQRKTYPPIRFKQYTPPAQIKQTLHTQPGVTYALCVDLALYLWQHKNFVSLFEHMLLLVECVGDSPHIMIIVLMRVNHFIYTMYNIYTIYTHCSLLTVD